MQETSPILKRVIIETVENQLRDNNPPETRLTLQRLESEGVSTEDAKKFIGCAISTEIFNIGKNKEEFNLERFVKNLQKLPTLPWED